VTEHFTRHGEHMTWTVIVTDPIYLTEPFIRNRDYVWTMGGQIPPYPCESVVEIVRPKGKIPNHLPGTNDQVKEYAVAHQIPYEAAMGGAETMYPEYKAKIKTMPPPPKPAPPAKKQR
jgi:hypothetical protein